MLLTITYHYVREQENSVFPGIHAVSPARLDRQLQYLSQNFTIIDPADLRQLLLERSDERYCLITFDDGLLEQYRNAKPLLEKHNIKGIFFTNGVNSRDWILSEVHKIHYIRSVTEPSVFTDRLSMAIESAGINVPLLKDEFEPPEGQNQYDDLEVQYTKYLLFHMLDESDRRRVVQAIYSEENVDEITHAKELYMDPEMLQDLAKDDCLGSHGWTHNVKNRSDLEETLEDFNKNQTYFEQLCGCKVDYVSYPYGGKHAVSPGVASMAKQAAHSFGFTIERAITTEFKNTLLLPRLDANDIPFGKRPLFEICNGRLNPSPGLKLGSDWYQ